MIVPTPSVAETIRELGVETPISLWPRGVNHRRFHPSARSLEWRRSLGIGDEVAAIGFLGRLVMEKGLDVFSDTIDELRSRGELDSTLVIYMGVARASDITSKLLAAGLKPDLPAAIVSAAHTAQQRFSAGMLCGLPVFAAIAMYFINYNYMYYYYPPHVSLTIKHFIRGAIHALIITITLIIKHYK